MFKRRDGGTGFTNVVFTAIVDDQAIRGVWEESTERASTRGVFRLVRATALHADALAAIAARARKPQSGFSSFVAWASAPVRRGMREQEAELVRRFAKIADS